jgi:hypothetical protein
VEHFNNYCRHAATAPRRLPVPAIGDRRNPLILPGTGKKNAVASIPMRSKEINEITNPL